MRYIIFCANIIHDACSVVAGLAPARSSPHFDDEERFDMIFISRPCLGTEEQEAVRGVLASGQLARGGQVAVLEQLARTNQLAIIEDACQAHAANIEGKPVGSFGIGCFSFYSTKNMTTGEGGMVTTNDPDIAGRVRLMRSHGQQARYQHVTMGH